LIKACESIITRTSIMVGVAAQWRMTS